LHHGDATATSPNPSGTTPIVIMGIPRRSGRCAFCGMLAHPYTVELQDPDGARQGIAIYPKQDEPVYDLRELICVTWAPLLIPFDCAISEPSRFWYHRLRLSSGGRCFFCTQIISLFPVGSQILFLLFWRWRESRPRLFDVPQHIYSLSR
jgi:hypothetical protein